MRLKRRRFLQTVAAAPAVSVLAQRATDAAPQIPRATPAATLTTTPVDGEAETVPRFFNAEQFAALRRLAPLFMPPRKGRPGALEAGAPEFLDFLIGESPAAQKELYRNGLDAFNTRARKQFGKRFADLDDQQADAILKPLVVTIAWVLDRPTDPLEHFVAQVHDDLREATINSLEWANAGSQQAGRRGRGATGLYIRPIDPVYRG